MSLHSLSRHILYDIHSLLSERIVQALHEMNCPFYLKPQSITCLKWNCRPLLPVVQWLAKLVIDYRRLTGDRTRNYSEFLFDSSTIGYNDNHLNRQCKESGREFLIHSVLDRYSLHHKFPKQNDIKSDIKEE